MWPNSKGKGQKGKDGSPKENEGKDKPPSKARQTKAKLKAMTREAIEAAAEAAAREKEAQDALEAADQSIDDEKDEPIGLSYGRTDASAPQEPTKDLIRLPASAGERDDDKISGVWKSRMLGSPRSQSQDMQSQTGGRNAIDANERARMNAQHESMVGLVDRMFDYFQNLAYDFNQMNPAPELEITWIRPTISRENISSWHQAAQYISVFTGRISTRHWTLVVRGTFEGVDCYVIPADKLLSFTTQPSSYTCSLAFEPVYDGHSVHYQSMQQNLNEEQIQMSLRAVLETLITVAQEDEPIRGHLDLFALGVFGGARPSSATSGSVAQEQSGGIAEIDYSARYREHMAEQGQSGQHQSPPASMPTPSDVGTASGFYSPSGAQQAYPSEFAVQGGREAFSGYTSTQNPALNQNASLDQFQSQSQSQSQSQPQPVTDDSDDWKPVVRNVRGVASAQTPSTSVKLSTDAGWKDMSQSQKNSTSNPVANGPIAPGPLPPLPKPGGFSAQALFQSANTGGQSGSGNPGLKDVPWNFMQGKIDSNSNSNSFASTPKPVDNSPELMGADEPFKAPDLYKVDFGSSPAASAPAPAPAPDPNPPAVPQLPTSFSQPPNFGQAPVFGQPPNFGAQEPPAVPKPPVVPEQDKTPEPLNSGFSPSGFAVPGFAPPSFASPPGSQSSQAPQAPQAPVSLPSFQPQSFTPRPKPEPEPEAEVNSELENNLEPEINQEPVPEPALELDPAPEPELTAELPPSKQVDELAFLIANEPVVTPYVEPTAEETAPTIEESEPAIDGSEPAPLFQESDSEVRDILAADTEINAAIKPPPGGIQPENKVEPAVVDSEPPPHSFKAKLESLLAAFDEEMEQVATKGSEAFSKRDLRKAEHLIKLAETISELKESISKFRDENSDFLS